MVFERYVQNPDLLITALALAPVIIAYLIRPKPKQKTIPSLMFFLKDQSKGAHNALFRRLMRELLFILHVLLVLLLVITVARPYLDVPATQLVTDTVIILDDSASMHATSQGEHRYERARQLALNQVGSSNTIILAGSIPRVILEQGSARDARELIGRWVPSETPTRLSPAILEAQRYADGGAYVAILSDFQDTDVDNNYKDAIQTVRATGASVQPIQVAEPTRQANNIGIVDLQVGEGTMTATVQNFYDTPQSTTICVEQQCQDLQLDAKGFADFSFSTIPGLSTVTIDANDDFLIDNQVTISAATKNDYRVLVITNGDFEQTPLRFALDSIQATSPLTFDIEVNTPPTLSTVDHDIIIFSDVDASLLVNRMVRQSEDAVRSGSAAIILYQNDLGALRLDELLPFDLRGRGESTQVLNTFSSQAFVNYDNNKLGSTSEYIQATPLKAVQTLFYAPDQYDSTLVSLYPVGAGRTLYYGLSEQATFTSSPSFPVFWKDALNILTSRRTAEELNLRSGVRVTTQYIEFPSGEERQGAVTLTQQGRYVTDEGVLTANLLNAKESQIAIIDQGYEGVALSYDEQDTTEQYDISHYFIIAILAFLFIELFYLKWRGDL